MSLRKGFIDFSSSFSGILPLDTLCALTGHHFIMPFYHIVSDEACPHIEHLYRFKNIKQFEQDIDYLASQYQPLGADALPDILAGKYKGKKTMLLSFDDGLRQMYEVVAPILLRKGIPAIFFLNTDFIDNRALMFRYTMSLMIEFGKFDEKVISLFRSMRHQKEMDAFFLSEAANPFKKFLDSYKPYMTTQQVKSLISQGFAIGAHSSSHPYYSDLSLTQQLSETFDCLNILQRDFGIKEKLFAFPFTDHGVSRKFFDSIFENNKIDFSFGGAGIKNDIHPRQFQRVPMEGWNATAEQILKSEYLYYLLRAPILKNKIKRS